jgi:hypothetical protein
MAKTKASSLGSAENPQAWIDGPNSYKLGLQNGKVVCQNAKGTQLATLPTVLKEDPITDQLQALATWLDDHRMDYSATNAHGGLARSRLASRT